MDIAVNSEAVGVFSDVAVYHVGKIERQGAFGQVVDIAFWRIDEDAVSEEVDV